MAPLPLWKVKGAARSWAPGVLLLGISVSGCIDPKADYDEFAARPSAQREGGAVDVQLTPCQELLQASASGKFFASCFVKAVQLPFSLSVEHKVRPSADGMTAEFDVQFTALTTTATNLNDTAGDLVVLPTTTIDSECRYRENIGTLILPAAANSLGRDLQSENVSLRGKLQSADRSCAELDGNVPLVNLSLDADGDVCVYLRPNADGSLPTVTTDDYVCDPSSILPR